MVEIDLSKVGAYPPLEDKSVEELFELGALMACTLRSIRVRTPAGDRPEDVVVLDGHLLCKKGVKVY